MIFLRPVSVLSGGEKSRLALLKIMLLDTNFLILDEPTKPSRFKNKKIFFKKLLLNTTVRVAIVSHDRYFLDRLVNKVFELKDGTINQYIGNYSYFIEKRGDTIFPSKENETLVIPAKDRSFKNKEKKRLEAEERNKLFQNQKQVEK